MHNNILVPDYSLPPAGYKPLYLYNEMDLINYLDSQQISPEFLPDVIAQLIKSEGIFNTNYVFFLQEQTRQMRFPTAPHGYFDDQHNFISYVCTSSVGSPQTYDREPEWTW